MEPSRNIWPLYRRLLRYTRPYRKQLWLGIGFGLLYAPTNSAALLVVKRVWASAFESGHRLAWYQIAGILALLPLVVCARGLFNFLQTYLMSLVGLQVVNDLRVALFAKVQTFSLDFFGEKRTGELISRISGDVGLVQASISTIVEDLLKQPVTLLFVLGTLFYLDWKLSLGSLVILPLCLLPVAVFGRKVRTAARAALQNQASLTSVLHEAITGWRVIKVFCAEAREVQDFRHLCHVQVRERLRVALSRALTEPLIECVASLGIAGVCAYAYMHQMKGSDIIAFAAGLFLLYEPVKKISRVHLHIQESMSAAERVFELLDRHPGVQQAPDARALPPLQHTIRFQQIGFSYDSQRQVLAGVDLEIPAGKVVALVGPSGSGKTTLLNLVPRFMDPSVGSVRIDGQDVRGVSFASLREQIGLVTQETFLFNDTIANNISYGKPSATRAEIIEAARRAHAHEFIVQLPKQYDTLAGEIGMKLSGGQRQRIAIARAILKNPPILLLDEATSALDTESERIVQVALDSLMWGENGQRGRRTMLVIAHRLSTVQHADRIVVLDQGRIVEQGTHDQLLARDGHYRRLHELQVRS